MRGGRGFAPREEGLYSPRFDLLDFLAEVQLLLVIDAFLSAAVRGYTS